MAIDKQLLACLSNGIINYMSSLSFSEKASIKRALLVEKGNVLGLRVDDMDNLFASFDVDIRAGHDGYSGSKAQRLSRFLDVEEDGIVAKVITELLKYADERCGELIDGDDMYKAKLAIDKLSSSIPEESGEIAALEDEADKEKFNRVCRRKLNKALREYRRGSADGKSNAVRELADIFENMKKQGVKLPFRDDSDLFNIINNFAIRHSNRAQRSGWNEDVWLDWMYHFFLATACALMRARKKVDDE